MHKHTVEMAKELCRELRKRQTRAEKIVWEIVRNRKFLSKKFLRQYPIFFTDTFGKECFYIADFYCDELKLVIEIDGKYHDYRQEHDNLRTEAMEMMSLTVIRFKNEEIENNLNQVLEKIKTLLSA